MVRNARVVGGKDGRLTLAKGDVLPFDAVLWATDASPPRLLRDAGLALNEGGFLRWRYPAIRDRCRRLRDWRLCRL